MPPQVQQPNLRALLNMKCFLLPLNVEWEKKLLKRNLGNRNIHTSQHRSCEMTTGVVKVTLSIKLAVEFGQNTNSPMCLLPVADEVSMAPASGIKKMCM